MSGFNLCNNCLGQYDDVKGVPVGHDKGGQREPYREYVTLCGTCAHALLAGDWATIHARYSETRQVTRERV